MSRESRAIRVVKYFMNNPVPIRKALKVHMPEKKWAQVSRVFKGTNEYTESDLDALEQLIKLLKSYEKTVKKATSTRKS